MAVGADNLACGDLVEYRLPSPVGYVRGDVEVLRPEMVELQDERIGLTTVNAGTRTEEVDEIIHPLHDERALALHGVRDVALAVQPVVFLFVRGSARPAVVISLASRLSAPGEV
jgi:hypothetical protein